MSDYIQDAGYFGYYPFENIRERKQGILVSQFQYPLDIDQMVSNKLDFTYVRLGYNNVDTFTLDTQATTSNILNLTKRGLSIGLYCTLTPWTVSDLGNAMIVGQLGTAFATAVANIWDITSGFATELVPMIQISDDGSMGTMTATAFQNFLDNFYAFYDGYLNSNTIYGLGSGKNRIIFRSDYNTASNITGTFSIANNYPMLCLDKAYIEEYASASTSTTYPATSFTTFGGYSRQAIHITYTGSGLNSKYGIGASNTVLFVLNDEYNKYIHLNEQTVPEDLNLYVLDEDFVNIAILNSKSLSADSSFEATRNVNIKGLDVLNGTVYQSEYTKYVAVGNYILLYDFDMKPQFYEIVEINSSSDETTFRAEHISTGLESEIITSETVGMEEKTVGEHIADALSGSTNTSWEEGDTIGIFDSETKSVTIELDNTFVQDLESGFLNATTGAEEVNASYVRNEDYFSIPKQSCGYYYFNNTTTAQTYLYYWNDKDEYIGRVDLGTTGTHSFTMPYNAKKGRLVINDTATTQEIKLTSSNFKGWTVKEFLDSLAKTFECSFKYRLELDETITMSEYFIDKYYVDVYKHLGNSDAGTIYEDGSNVGQTNYNERKEELYTAIIPTSDNVPYSDWLSYSNTDAPYYKASGTAYMYNIDTFDSYNKIGQHRVTTEVFNDALDMADLFEEGKKYLENCTKPRTQFSMETTLQVPTLMDYPKIGDTSNIIISSFKSKRWDKITTIRYIRNKVNGSNVNTSAVFNEIRAFDKIGVNVAIGATVTGEEFLGGTWNNVTTPALTSGGTGWGVVTDNNPSSWLIPTYNATPQRVTVDLGDLYEIEMLRIIHYYVDNRAFKENVTEVSADGTTWYTLYDSDIQGEYPETGEGNYQTEVLLDLESPTFSFHELLPEERCAWNKILRVDDTKFLVFHLGRDILTGYTLNVTLLQDNGSSYTELDSLQLESGSSNGYFDVCEITTGRYMIVHTADIKFSVISINSDVLTEEEQYELSVSGVPAYINVAVVNSTQAIITYTETNILYALGVNYDISTETITVGTPLQITTGTIYEHGRGLCKYASNKAISTHLSISVYRPQYILLEINTSTLAITAGTMTQISSIAGYGTQVTQLDDNEVLLTYVRTTGMLLARVLTISGATVSIGTLQEVVDIGTISTSSRYMTTKLYGNLLVCGTTMFGYNRLVYSTINELNIVSYDTTQIVNLNDRTLDEWKVNSVPDFEFLKLTSLVISDIWNNNSTSDPTSDESCFLSKGLEAVVETTTYSFMLRIPVPYDLIGNSDGFVYDNASYTSDISEITYKLNYPKEVQIQFGEIQRDITDNF